MPESIPKEKRKFSERLKDMYRLVFFNDSTLEEVFHIRMTLMNVLSIIGTIIIILVGGSIALTMFSPLRELIPGYPSDGMRRQILTNAIRLDSLEHEIHLRDRYFNTVNAIVAGREPEFSEVRTDTAALKYDHITFTRSEEDSLLRRRVEEEERFNFAPHSSVLSHTEDISMSKIHFFKPVEGIVSSKFDLNGHHFGIDLVAGPSEVVKSTLDGTVIMAEWTSETGYIIEVHHASNIVSVYKHNASLLKRQGDRVKAGDAIAIVGNSGELTTGPHLHFELWQSGTPINPEDYISY